MATSLEALKPAEDHPKAAPGALNQIRRFVNTLDLEDGSDQIADPKSLREWLTERNLLRGDEPLIEVDVRQAHELREALRKLLLANNGDPLDPTAVDALNATARRAELQLRFDGSGEAELKPVRTGFEGAAGCLLEIVFRAMANGTWPRLKACKLHDTCEAAFYDWSKNRSGQWCDMAVCGNREKARAYRERKRGAR